VRTKLARLKHVAGLERVLEALGEVLIESTDEELLAAARELGMDPAMRGSAAFIGLKYPVLPRGADFFAPPAQRPSLSQRAESPTALPPSRRLPSPKRRSRRPGRGSKPDPK